MPPCTRNNVKKNKTMDNGPIAAKAMALIGNITISHIDSYAVGNPQYSSKPATCPTINIPHTIIQLRKELLILKRLILHLLLSLAAGLGPATAWPRKQHSSLHRQAPFGREWRQVQ